MRKYLPISIFFIFIISGSPVTGQKVSVDLRRSIESSLSFWQVMDEYGMEIISANGQLNENSVTFSLDADRLYSLRITIQDTIIPIMLDYTLGINGEDILRIIEKSPTGEHEYKFFTGLKEPVTKIVGGTATSISEFPWQVYYKSGNYRCGGTIIAPNWVLTAAHCTEDGNHSAIDVSSMSIIVGTTYPTQLNSGKTYLISEVIRHENYNSALIENDIALLRLDQPINYPNATPIKLISPIDVNDGATAPGVMAWVTGWGVISVPLQITAFALQKVQLPIVSNQQASEVWSSIPSSDLMAGYLKGNKDACSGDSGGPLVVPVTGEYKLAGIVSWGNADCNTYGGYTRVSDFIEWIASKTGIEDFRPDAPAGITVACNPSDTASYTIEPYPSGTNYQWKLFPESTGTLLVNSLSTRVAWNKLYSGQAYIMVRTQVNNIVSDWAKTRVLVSPKIKLLDISGDITKCADQPVKMLVDAEGYNLNYKWYMNNLPFQSGSSNFVSLTSVNHDNSGIYKCVISDACNTLTTDNINLSVLPLTAITDITHNIEVPFGNNPILEVNSEGHNISYQWEKDGTLIADAGDPVLPLYDVNTKDIGLYRVTLTGTCGIVTSDSIYVYVNSKETSDSVDVFVWPTVAADEFNIAVNNDDEYTVQMYNSRGSLIKELRNCRYQINLYAGTLSPGNYILNVFNSKYRKSIKVIKR
jgi:secreted trypsin-like serine protease